MDTLIYLVRHGQSLANIDHIFAGHTDVDLSELGYKQAEVTCAELNDVLIDAVYASDLKRAFKTAKVHADLRGLPCIPDKRLRELYLGDWEYATVDYLKENYHDLYFDFWVGNFGEFCAPNGEYVPDLAERMYDAIVEHAKENIGKTILIGSHAGAIKALWGKINNIPWHELASAFPYPSNASYSKILYDGEKLIPIEYSHDEHLGSLLTKWIDK